MKKFGDADPPDNLGPLNAALPDVEKAGRRILRDGLFANWRKVRAFALPHVRQFRSHGRALGFAQVPSLQIEIEHEIQNSKSAPSKTRVSIGNQSSSHARARCLPSIMRPSRWRVTGSRSPLARMLSSKSEYLAGGHLRQEIRDGVDDEHRPLALALRGLLVRMGLPRGHQPEGPFEDFLNCLRARRRRPFGMLLPVAINLRPKLGFKAYVSPFVVTDQWFVFVRLDNLDCPFARRLCLFGRAAEPLSM